MLRLLFSLALIATTAATAADKPLDPGQYFFNETFRELQRKSWKPRAPRVNGAFC